MLCGLLFTPGLARFVRADLHKATSQSDSEAGIEIRNTSAVGILFGEFRAGMSDIMFVKTEHYLHAGVGYRNHHCDQESEGPGETEGEGHEDHLAETIIKGPAEDWRSFIGDLEREVKPWVDPKDGIPHSAGEELLPWYRLAVTANPHNEHAYRIGSYWLMIQRTENCSNEALRFVEDGIRNNPKSFALYLTKGKVLHGMKRSEDALAAFTRGAEIAKEARSAEGFPVDNPNDMRESDFRGLMRFRAFFLEILGRKGEALKAVNEFKALVPDDTTLDVVKERLENSVSR